VRRRGQKRLPGQSDVPLARSAIVHSGVAMKQLDCCVGWDSDWPGCNAHAMKLINQEVIEGLIQRASDSPRRRSHHNFHESPSDPIQRYLIGTKLGSYFRPHCHETQSEFAVVIQGAFEFVIFDHLGMVRRKIRLGHGGEASGFEIPALTWHTWIPLEENSVFLEVKAGPYDAKTSSTFAAWSPAEGDEKAGQFLTRLKGLKVGDRAE
jgi:cupin fold WbuC family metalloprotein